jgi:glycosyltransferase involved in cell wall biosynthesis
MVRVFGSWCACDVSEWFTLLSPLRVDTFLLREPRSGRKTTIYAQAKNVVILSRIPKSPTGIVGNPRVSTMTDFLLHCFFIVLIVPFLLFFYEVFIFVCPPFFETVVSPFLRIFRKKVILISIDDWVAVGISSRESFRSLKFKLGRLLELFSIKSATAVVVVSQHLFNLYKPYNRNIIYAPNGADVEKIEKIRSRKMFEEPVIAYFGGIEIWRGIDLLIDAFRLVRRKGVRVKLLIMGTGMAFEEMRKYAKGDPDIIFTGHVDHDVGISYLKAARVAVIPNRKCIASQSISSIKCFEYIACEIPSVVTDSGEHAYWVRKLSTGIVVKDTAESLAEGILRLLTDRRLYARIKQNCRKHKWEVDFRNTRRTYIDAMSKLLEFQPYHYK